MDIPTIEVEVSKVTIFASSFNQPSASPMTPGEPLDLSLPARLIAKADTSYVQAYGPGSVTYEVTSVQVYNETSKTYDPVAVDPKTYIDNYGIIHVGPSNLPDYTARPKYRIAFNAIYHYVNPSTGAAVATAINNLQITPFVSPVILVQDERTAIPYQPQPGTNG